MDNMHPDMQEGLRAQEPQPEPPQPAAQPDPWADYDRRALDRQIRAGGCDYAY